MTTSIIDFHRDRQRYEIVGSLEVLIDCLNDGGLKERDLPAFLESGPKFDQLDLIEFAKVLHDFAIYWRSHNRHGDCEIIKPDYQNPAFGGDFLNVSLGNNQNWPVINL